MLISSESFDGIPDVIELLSKNKPDYIQDANNPLQFVPGRHGKGLSSPFGSTYGVFEYSIPALKQSTSTILGWSYKLQEITIPQNGLPMADLDANHTFHLYINPDRSISFYWDQFIYGTSDPETVVFGEDAYYEIKAALIPDATPFAGSFELHKNGIPIITVDNFLPEARYDLTYRIDWSAKGHKMQSYSLDADIAAPAVGGTWFIGGWDSDLTVFHARSADNGVTWSTIDTHYNNEGEQVAWNGSNLYVAAGSNYPTGDLNAVTSTDGITWTNRTTPFDEASGFTASVAYSPALNLFVLTGFGNSHTIATSSDGITWTPRANALDSPPHNASANGVAWSPTLGMFAVAGAGLDSSFHPVPNAIVTSPDGITWTQRTTTIDSGPSLGPSMAWGNGMFVVCGYHGASPSTVTRMETSTDGITWTIMTPPAGVHPQFVVWDSVHSVWIVSTDSVHLIYTTPDFITWTQRTTPADGTGGPSAVASNGHGKVLLCTNDTAGEMLMVSTDGGANWGRVTTPFGVGGNLQQVSYLGS